MKIIENLGHSIKKCVGLKLTAIFIFVFFLSDNSLKGVLSPPGYTCCPELCSFCEIIFIGNDGEPIPQRFSHYYKKDEGSCND